MSDIPPVEKIPLAFVYTCKHFVCGYFRRADGRPLDISEISSPEDPDVISEPLDLALSPDVRPEICLASCLCDHCKRNRLWSFDYLKDFSRQRPDLAVWEQTTLRRMRDNDLAMDVSLMARVLGTETDVWNEQERMARELIAPPAKKHENDDSSHSQAPPAENTIDVDDHGDDSQSPPPTGKKRAGDDENANLSPSSPAKKHKVSDSDSNPSNEPVDQS